MRRSTSTVKMKIFLCLFLVLGINYGLCNASILSHDLEEIGALVPNQDLFQIFDPIKFIPSSKQASNYVASIDFHNGIYLITMHYEMVPIKQYLDMMGVDLNKIFLNIVLEREKLSRRFDIEPVEKVTVKLHKFVESAYSVSQKDNIISLVIQKTAESQQFRNLYTLLNNLNHVKVYSDLQNVQKVRDMVKYLNEIGINTAEVWRLMSYLFGWDTVTNVITLEEYEVEEENRDPEESPLFLLLRQYLNLIPKEKFIFLYRGLLANPLFQEIVTYIFNKEYHKILANFDNNSYIGEFFDYLRNKGVSVYKYLDLIRDRLGFVYAFQKMPNGLNEETPYSFLLCRFFDLANHILPLNEIRKLTDHLLKTNEDYRELTEKITNLIYNNDVQLYFENQKEIREVAVQYGFSISKIMHFIFLLIGIEYNAPIRGKEFTDNLFEFVDLFPKNEYINLYSKYKNDTNIWKLVTYLKGPKFGDFIEALFSTVEIKLITNFLLKQFVPVKALIVDILDRLGIMQWWTNYDYFCGNSKKCNGAINSNSDNLNNFIKERINLFPIKQILVLFHNKLLKNTHFQNLYRVMANTDAPSLFKKITEHFVLRDFFVKITKIGYNVREIIHQFSQLFGWGNFLNVDLSLNQTIQNFDNLIYRKELFAILKDYPIEVEQLVEYFKNSAFVNSLNLFINEPNIRNIITWMENLNVPVIDYVNYYSGHDSPNVYHLRLDTQLKWTKLCADVVKFLKKNKFFDFTIAQKYNSIEFHALLEKIIALNVKTFTGFWIHPEFQFVLDKLFSTDIDYYKIVEFLQDVKNNAYDKHKLIN